MSALQVVAALALHTDVPRQPNVFLGTRSSNAWAFEGLSRWPEDSRPLSDLLLVA